MRRSQRNKKFSSVRARNTYFRPQSYALFAALGIALLIAGAQWLPGIIKNTPLGLQAAVSASEIISLTNEDRLQNNVGALSENPELDAAAQAKVADMAAQGYFAHIGPGGKEPWDWIREAGYMFRYAGENLAVRFYNSSDVVNAWMTSPSHRANMLKPQYTDIGVGVATGTFEGQPATYIVQYFGSPLVPHGSVSPAQESTTTAAIHSNISRTQGASVIESTTTRGLIDAQAASALAN